MDRIVFKEYAGVRIKGQKPLSSFPLSRRHLDRASRLTAEVESGGRFGSVMSYDGTGMTAGIHQAIAVYPKNLKEQGPLWKLLLKIKEVWFAFAEAPPSSYFPGASWPEFEELLNASGLLFTSEGVLRHKRNGKRLVGGEIREEFTGTQSGIMPANGPRRKRAEKWALAFHRLFSADWTFAAQLYFGEEEFLRGSKLKLIFSTDKALVKYRLFETVYVDMPTFQRVTFDDLGLELDLALSVYWSYFVNAPSQAFKMFNKAISKYNGDFSPEKFPAYLIECLGDSFFGRWGYHHSSGRYQRTRDAAFKIWPKELFVGPKAIMPKSYK